jgi:YgiT-type zinc finger domain-containing protein
MAPNPPPSIPPCPLCGGLRVQADGSGMGITKLGGMFRLVQQLTALVCTRCGSVTFYVDNPQDFLPKR